MAGESTDRTDSPGPEQCDAARRRHQAWLSALLLGMMVLAVLGAYLAGKLVRTLADDRREAGTYQVWWDGRDAQGRDVPSGVYFYRLWAGEFTAMKKMVLLR